MEHFRREEGASKGNINEMLNLGEMSSLYSSSISGIEMQVVVISGHCCDYCNSLNNNRYDFTDYIMNRRFDRSKCTRETGCNCTSSAIGKRDENGGLIINYPEASHRGIS